MSLPIAAIGVDEV